MRILLCCIFKGDSEIDMAERMFSSFMPHVQGLVCAITGVSGKNKKLIELIKKYNGQYVVTSPKTDPEIYLKDKNGYFFANFAKARNVTFDMADKLNYDWYIWADVDDILVAGEELQAIAQNAHNLKLDRVFIPYWYSVRLKEDGSFGYEDVHIEHLRERLIKPKIFKWTSRLHEVLVPKENGFNPRDSLYEYNPKEGRNCVWAHITDGERVMENMQRNIRLLEQQIKEEDSKDPRTIFYLAKTYYDMKTKEKDELALFLIQDYLHGEHPSGWAEERGNAYEYMANIYARRGNHQKAIECLHESLKEFPARHMSILLLAKEYAEQQDHEKSAFWLDTAMKMDPPSTRTTIGNPMEVKFTAASLKYNEAIRKVDLDGAIFWMKKRLEIGAMPDDGMLKTLEDAKKMDDAAKNVYNYAIWLKQVGQTKYIHNLLKSLPPELGREQFALRIANEIAEPKVWGNNTIVYFASWGGQGIAEWTPDSLKEGLGGSETAVVELSKRWVKMGYDVTVFTDVGVKAGDYEGVHYRPWYELNWNDTFNILILWRSPHILDREIKAKRVMMDLHDVSNNLDWNEKRVAMVDKVFFKSNFHRKMIPNLPDDKCVIISNGLDTVMESVI